MYELKFRIGLKKIIRDSGLKQSVIAKKTGMRPETLCRILSGKRRIYADEMAAICDELGMKVEEVIVYGECEGRNA